MKNKIVLLTSLFLLTPLKPEATTAEITQAQQDEMATRNLQETTHLITQQIQQLFAGIITLFQQGEALEKIEDVVEDTAAEVLEEVAAEIVEEALEEAAEQTAAVVPVVAQAVAVQTVPAAQAIQPAPAQVQTTQTELQNNITALLQETQEKLAAIAPEADHKTLEDISHQLLAMLETVKTVSVRRPLRAIDFNAWNQLLETEEQTRQAEDDNKEQDEE